MRTLFVAAAVLAVVGTLAIVGAFVWAAASSSSPPLALYLVSMLLPAGMLVAGVAVVRDYRTPR